ncbi:sigma factor-like helix-turn-helix DNA-binding protein [Lapidilactobacillus dextrinicus]|uniref:sigma factor-like helix-turn-helix DNA-binding protein n=1 Tax=Lapidilactobacillus dextrinicus TaxID=51664 RepID=UPI003F257E20
MDQLIRSETPHLLERMSFNDIWNIEDFIENDQLALAISTLTIRQKFIIYWKFVEEATDQQIGELLGISSQAVSKQKRHTLGILAEAFFKF